MTLYLGNNLISGVAYPTEPTRNLGQIIESIVPLTDAGLHLLDGTLISGAGIYADFVTAIGDIYDGGNYPDLFETEANWQTAVTTYGVCGKFVYDSVNNTVRLPKITGIIEGTTDLTALGDLVQAGLPIHTHTRGTMNITGSFGTASQTQYRSESGAFYKGSGYTGNGVNNTDNMYVGFDASRSWTGNTSNPIYSGDIQNSSTVQPQTIKAFYYIVIATSTKTDIQVDIDEIATDLNGKADTDLTNLSNAGNIKTAHNAMPSSTYIELTLGASGTTYYAPADGWYFLLTNARSSSTPAFSTLYSNNYLVTSIANASVNWEATALIPVRKGVNVTVAYGTTDVNYTYFRFFYANGSESEAT